MVVPPHHSADGALTPPFISGKAVAYLPIGVSAIFVLVPQLDLAVSGFFFQSRSFAVSEMPFWIGLRSYFRASQTYTFAAMIMCLLVYALSRRPIPLIAPHKIAYFTLTFVVGAGLVVQGLKFLMGRARPYQVTEFGGSLEFTPAWQIASNCMSSCSFPSASSAAAAAMLLLAIFVPERWRKLSVILLLPLLLLISLNRVFMGAHFLSDVLISWAIVLRLMAWLGPYFSRNARAIDGYVRRQGRRLIRIRSKVFVGIREAMQRSF